MYVKYLPFPWLHSFFAFTFSLEPDISNSIDSDNIY